MTTESSRHVNEIFDLHNNCAFRKGPRRRRAALLRAAGQSGKARRVVIANERIAAERPSQRLRKILLTNPRARHFSVERIISSLGEDPHGPTLALFSAAGVFEAPGVQHLSGVMTGAVGAQIVFRRRRIKLPRALLRRKIPRSSLTTLIEATANLLEKAEAVVQERWRWVFNPGMAAALGVLIFLLGVASMTPVLGMVNHHAASAFLMSIGLAERDGLVVMIAAIAGVASLALAVANAMSGRRLWTTTKDWLLECFRRLRLRLAAAFLDRIDRGLGELLRLTWSDITLTFFADFAGPKLEHATAEARAAVSLRARVQKLRLAESQRADQGRR